MRKLATAALAFSAAVFLANYILPSSWLTAAAVLSTLLCAALALAQRKWLRPVAIVLLFFAIGLLEYVIYTQMTVDRAKEYAGQTCEVRGIVLDYPDVYERYARLRIRITSEDLPHFKAIVYDNQKQFLDAKPGDHVSFTAKISTADTLYGKPYANYNISGFYLRLSIKSGEMLQRGHFSVRTLPVMLHHYLCERVEKIFPADCRAFIKALMLGEKDDFYADDALYVSMSRSGLMHVVAVSGLHISFLVGLLTFLLGNGKSSAVCSIVLIWCFVLITGSSSSAVRAAFMQTLLLLAPVLRQENDSITSLSAILALLLAVCPFAAKSVSLQMSFAAMAGIICFGQRLYSNFLNTIPEKLNCRVIRYALGVAASTLSVMVFTVPLTALHFSYVPILSLISNVACIWAVSLCFCVAWAACLLDVIPVLGTAAGLVCALLVRYILHVAGFVAHIPYSVLYLKNDWTLLWMLFSYAMLLLGFLLHRRRILRVLLPTGLSLSLLVGIIVYTEHYYREHDFVTVLNVGQGQCITAFAGDETAIIDCGSINSLDNAGALAGEYLLSCGRHSVELMILTHLHTDHADGVVRLMEMLPVNTLILPTNTDDDGDLRDNILACAEKHGTKVEMIDGNARASCGRLDAQIFKLNDEGDENERCLMIDLAVGENHLLVTADAPKKLERELVDSEELEDTDILIVGHHGSKYASADELLQEAGGGLAVISVGYNTFGHPAPETLEALEVYGYEIKRTDEDGTVEIRLEREHGEKTG